MTTNNGNNGKWQATVDGGGGDDWRP